MKRSRTHVLGALTLTLTALAACGGDSGGSDGATASANPLLSPSSLNATAPAEYQVRFETSKGDFVVDVHRDWAPNGADRFYNLVTNGFYDGVRFFRVIPNFMAQFGINGDPQVSARWRNAAILDDPVTQSNVRGTLTFAATGRPNSRTTQVFINFRDNSNLDAMGFAPFGEVVEGMDVVDQLYSGYGEGAPNGQGPDQNQVQARGNEYLQSDFPQLDSIVSATVVGG